MQSLKNIKSKPVGRPPKMIKPKGYKYSKRNTVVFIILVIIFLALAFKLGASTVANEPIQQESATLDQPTPTQHPLTVCDNHTLQITDGEIIKECYVNITPTPTPAVKKQSFLESSVFPITREYDIPDALVASQWALEGGRITSNTQNNLFGLMANGKLINYPSIEANVRDYALTIKNILKAKNFHLPLAKDEIILALQSGDKPRDEGHNPDPMTYVYTIKSLPEWEL